MAQSRQKSRKISPSDMERAIVAIEAEIGKARKKRVGADETFTAPSREELIEKLERAESPMIIWQGWSNSAPAGGTINYSVGVSNPDPFAWGQLSVGISIGNRNAIASNDVFLSGADSRFPTLAEPATTGFSLDPVGLSTASTSFTFALAIPPGVAQTGYFGNTVLQQLNFHDVGTYLDRAVFFFSIV